MRRFWVCFGVCFFLFSGTPPAFSLPGTLSIDLGRAYELALGSDIRVKAAESDAAKANEERRQAHRTRGVTLNMEHTTARTHYQNPGQGYPTDANFFQNELTATYPVYTGGKIEAGIAAAEAERKSKLLSLELARQDVKLSAASAFYTMLRTEGMAKLAADAVTRLEEHVRNVSAQYRNGKVGKADLLRSEVALISAEQQRGQADNEHRVAVKSLNNLMGLHLDTELTHEEAMTYLPFEYGLDECLEYALSHHPNMAVAGLLAKKAEAGIAAAKADKKPQVSFAVTQIWNSMHNWPGSDADNLQVALQALYTFSDAGIADSKIRSAKEDLKQAGYNSESVRDTIVLNVTRYFMNLKEAESRIETGLTALDKARETYRLALVRYREGVGTNIDVLDAQSALSETDSGYTQALCDYNIAFAQVENAMGAPFSAETRGRPAAAGAENIGAENMDEK
jgi:outer membrane protein TolC